MLPRVFWLAALLAVGAHAQSSDSTSSDSSSRSSTASGSSSGSSGSSSGSSSASIITLTGSQVSVTSPTGSYISLGGQVTASSLYATRTSSSSSSGTESTSTTTSRGSTSTITLLEGGGVVTELVINGTYTSSSHLNATTTSSSTNSAAAATNTQPCNNYPEFCDRKYGNITEVVAHNAAFVKKGNAASNQELDITTQLNDGIRMIQGEVHWNESGLYNCHSSCDILYAGTYLSTLKTIYDWVKDHPYDVVTILMVNSQYAEVGNFSAVYEESGLLDYIYEPPYIPMKLSDWPTLSELILTQKRVIVFMDYEADQAAVPYILDEFTHIWETPFSPTNRAFPCTIQRPPNANETYAKEDMMYLANHNLNTDVSIFGINILVPTTSELNVTNAAGTDTGMLGEMNNNCTATWDRPPNWLLVDFYDHGSGSVFEVAAKANNVTYDRSCCGASSSGTTDIKSSATALVIALIATFLFVV